MAALELTQEQRQFIEQHCMAPDFPEEGVQFLDIFPFMEKYYHPINLDLYIDDSLLFVPEARGFLFYHNLGAKHIIPLRKNKKLPGKLIDISTKKEYGEDVLSFQGAALQRHIDAYVETHPHATVIPVSFFDDVAATGQTAESLIKFFKSYTFGKYSFRFIDCKFYFELTKLGARKRIEDLGVAFNTVYSY